MQTAFWVWLHLLQKGAASQYLSASRDKLTAPHLPIPAGRTTKYHVETLRWLLVPACLAQSLRYGVHTQGITAMFLILALNELKPGRHWIITSVLRAALFVVLDQAALVVAGK